MKVYVLTSESYHDNSVIIGIYSTEYAGINALKTYYLSKPSDPGLPLHWNVNDLRLVEWDIVTNTQSRVWLLEYKHIWTSEGKPSHTVFTLTDPEGKEQPLEELNHLCSG